MTYETRGLSEGIFTGGVVLGQMVWNGVLESHNQNHERARQELARVRSQNETIAALNKHVHNAYDTIDKLKEAKRQYEEDCKQEMAALRQQMERERAQIARERAAFKEEERKMLLRNVFNYATAIASGALRQAEQKMLSENKHPDLLKEAASGIMTKRNSLGSRYPVTKADLIFWTAFAKTALKLGAPIAEVQKEVNMDVDVSIFMPQPQNLIELEDGGRLYVGRSDVM